MAPDFISFADVSAAAAYLIGWLENSIKALFHFSSLS